MKILREDESLDKNLRKFGLRRFFNSRTKKLEIRPLKKGELPNENPVTYGKIDNFT